MTPSRKPAVKWMQNDGVYRESCAKIGQYKLRVYRGWGVGQRWTAVVESAIRFAYARSFRTEEQAQAACERLVAVYVRKHSKPPSRKRGKS